MYPEARLWPDCVEFRIGGAKWKDDARWQVRTLQRQKGAHSDVFKGHESRLRRGRLSTLPGGDPLHQCVGPGFHHMDSHEWTKQKATLRRAVLPLKNLSTVSTTPTLMKSLFHRSKQYGEQLLG